jgi:hypothetical protein
MYAFCMGSIFSLGTFNQVVLLLVKLLDEPALRTGFANVASTIFFLKF